MGEKDITYIVINNNKIGIVGLEAAMDSVARLHAGKTDAEIEAELLRRLSELNYIPKKVESEYAHAFLQEYKKLSGMSVEEQGQARGLEIEILGPGCTRCDMLMQEVMDILSEMGIAAAVDHVTDIREIARSGIRGAPALIINRRVVCAGQVPERSELKKWIAQAVQRSTT